MSVILIILAVIVVNSVIFWLFLWNSDPSPKDKPRYDFDENHPESDHEKQWRNE